MSSKLMDCPIGITLVTITFKNVLLPTMANRGIESLPSCTKLRGGLRPNFKVNLLKTWKQLAENNPRDPLGER